MCVPPQNGQQLQAEQNVQQGRAVHFRLEDFHGVGLHDRKSGHGQNKTRVHSNHFQGGSSNKGQAVKVLVFVCSV